MVKNFDQWNNQKKKINKSEKLPFFHEWEFWWANVWLNIWREQDWKWEKNLRPVVILKKFNKNIFLWIPLTSNNKWWKYYYWFNFNWKFSNAILSQIRLFDSKRLFELKWKINKDDLLNIKKEIKKLFD